MSDKKLKEKALSDKVNKPKEKVLVLGYHRGLKESGNINLNNRPRVQNKDGSVSTVRSMSVNIDNKELLIPTVSDAGKVMSDEESIQTYLKTRKHFGSFESSNDATEYAKKLHDEQESSLKKKINDSIPRRRPK